MRILLVSLFYEHDFGGAELVARRARALLLAAGWEVDVLCLAGGQSQGNKGFYRLTVPAWRRLGEQWFKRSILFLPGLGLDRRLFAQAKRQIDLSVYEGVFCPDFNAIVLASELAGATGCSLALWLQENLPRRLDRLNIRSVAAPLIQRLLEKREPVWRQAIGECDAVACVSDFTREQGIAFAEGPQQFSTLYPPLDEVLEKVQPSPSRCEEPARLLFLGRLSLEKGVDLLLDAHAQMREAATLTLVGLEGPLTDEVRSAVGRDERIRLLPPVSPSRVPALIDEHEIVCAPSRVEESLCRTALEGRLMERLVVASDHGAIPEVLADYPLAYTMDAGADAGAFSMVLDKAVAGRRELDADERDAEKDFLRRFAPDAFAGRIAGMLGG
jgi:glycosyltransferase involved in cell wall biosynthesis